MLNENMTTDHQFITQELLGHNGTRLCQPRDSAAADTLEYYSYRNKPEEGGAPEVSDSRYPIRHLIVRQNKHSIAVKTRRETCGELAITDPIDSSFNKFSDTMAAQ